MSSAFQGPVFVLNFHADYACRQSGACCTAGWDVPVEPDAAGRIEAALLDGRLQSIVRDPETARALVRCHPLPDGAAAILGKDAAGACMFLDRRHGPSCLVHGSLGHEALPAACRQFPRIALLDQRGIHVTLSHFCPTAAALLLRDEPEAAFILENAPRFRERPDYDGFDATTTIPPLVRPGVAFDLESYAMWERWQIRTFGRAGLSAEDAMRTIAMAAEAMRAWSPEHGTLLEAVERAAADADAAWRRHPVGAWAPARVVRVASSPLQTFEAVARLVRPGLVPPVAPPDFDRVVARFVEPVWAGLSRPVRRYLAAKAFAEWSAYQGEGVRTSVTILRIALDVLGVECARQAARADRPLDASLLIEAFRQSDLLLEHLVDRSDLARLAAPVEFLDRESFLARFLL